jgi:large subunit ribosomal protein L15
MKYNELVAKKQQPTTRMGRGISAGRGKTAGRGTKGQGARKSGNVRPGFEGGQMPLYMRIPKLRGFKSLKTKAEIVYTKDLNELKKAVIDNQTLAEAGLVSSPHVSVKVLLKGEINTKKDIKLQAASVGAITAIDKAGGSFKAIPQLGRQSKKDQAVK